MRIVLVHLPCTIDIDEPAPAKTCASAAAGASYQAGGQILSALFTGLEQLLQNPEVQALIATLLSGLLKTPAPAPTPGA